MSDGFGIKAETVVHLTATKVVESMDAEDIGLFCSAVAERLDTEFAARARAAAAFSGGLSENGARFLAEVVTQFYMRQP